MSAEQAARGRAIEAHRMQSTLALVQVALATGLLGLLVGAALAWFTATPDDRQIATGYLRTHAVQHIRAAIIPGVQIQTIDGEAFAKAQASDRATTMRLARRTSGAGILTAILLAAGLTTLQRRQWIKTGEAASMDQVLSGARIASPQQLASMLAWIRKTGVKPLMIGDVPLPPKDENRHLLVGGTTGTGKTGLLRRLLRQFVERGEHVILYDPDGGYIERYFDPAKGDIIINPWDARSRRWDLLADIATLADALRIAAVLLPKPSAASEAAIWYDQARALLACILLHLAHQGGSLDELAAMLNGADAESLRPIVAGTPAALIFTAGGERATASVLFMMAIAARTIATLAAVSADAAPFSFDRFYAELDEHPGPKPLIFLSCPRRYRDAGTPVITALVDAAASAILQREPDQGSTVWIMLDELPTLPPVSSLNVLLPESRKYRASVVLAFQSIGQLHERYGEAATHTLTGQAATQLWMGAGDSLTAKWVVDAIGTTEVEVTRPTATINDSAKGERGSLAVTRERKSLIVDAHVTGLKVGEAFLRLSSYPVARITIPAPEDEPVIAPAFLPAPAAAAKAAEAQTIPIPPLPSRVEDRDGWLPMLDAF